MRPVGTQLLKLKHLTEDKTGFVACQVLQLITKLQNYIYPKTGRYKSA